MVAIYREQHNIMSFIKETTHKYISIEWVQRSLQHSKGYCPTTYSVPIFFLMWEWCGAKSFDWILHPSHTLPIAWGGHRGHLMQHHSVHFRISLKRGQMSSARIQGGGATQIQGGGQPHTKYRESQLIGGEGKLIPGGAKAPPGSPEINPAACDEYLA